MTNKIHSLAFEPATENLATDVYEIREKLLINGVSDDKFLTEIESFAERNSLAVSGFTTFMKKPRNVCCSSCLKAHILKISQDKNILKVINGLLPCEAGHSGYYTDNGELKKV